MKSLVIIILVCLAALQSTCQVSINNDGSAADASSMLDVKSTTRGILVPRMTTAQRDAISSPATGLLIYCTSNNQYYTNKGTPASPNWVMTSSQWISSGTNLYYSGGLVGIGTSSPQQALHVAGKIVAEWGTVSSASYRFGDGSENTGLSSPATNAISIVNNGVHSVRIDASGRMGIGTSSPNSSSALDLTSTSRGFLPPRMTDSQMKAISSPPAGLMVYNTTFSSVFWYNGTSWDIGANRDGHSCGTVTYGGKTYNSVIIGNQCWMDENLNIGVAIIGTENQTNNGILEKYCYDNSTANCNTYGGLYQWDEMMQYVTTEGAQGICPGGWHIPSLAELNTLIHHLDSAVAGGKMKEAGLAHWASPNTGATNSSGFTALPGGYKNACCNFGFLTVDGWFWVSTQGTTTWAWSNGLSYAFTNCFVFSNLKSSALSCRCVRD